MDYFIEDEFAELFGFIDYLFSIKNRIKTEEMVRLKEEKRFSFEMRKEQLNSDLSFINK